MNICKRPRGTGVDHELRGPSDLILALNDASPDLTPSVEHGCWSFAFVLQGHYTETGFGATRDRRPGGLHFHPEGAWRITAAPGTLVRCFGGVFDPKYVRESLDLGDRAIELTGCQPKLLAAHMMREYLYRDESSHLAIESLFLEMVADVVRARTSELRGRPSRSWLESARDLLEHSPTRSYSLSEVAFECGIHPTHLARTFRKQFGTTLGGYHRSIRLRQALVNLMETETAIGEIGVQAGFTDHAHFTRSIRKATGLNPSEVRRRARAD